MSNIEGEKLMGAGGGAADVGIVPDEAKQEAAARLDDLKQLRFMLHNIQARQAAGEVFLMDSPEAEVYSDYNFKRDDALLFLLEQFSK